MARLATFMSLDVGVYYEKRVPITIWDGPNVVASADLLDYNPDLAGLYSSSQSSVSVSPDGAWACFAAYDDSRGSDFFAYVLSESGSVVPIPFSFASPGYNAYTPPSTFFCNDGYLYNGFAGERCKVGVWELELTGLPRGKPTPDYANNRIYILLDEDEEIDWRYRAFDMTSLEEVDMPFELPPAVSASEYGVFDMLPSPTGDSIEFSAYYEDPANPDYPAFLYCSYIDGEQRNALDITNPYYYPPYVCPSVFTQDGSIVLRTLLDGMSGNRFETSVVDIASGNIISTGSPKPGMGVPLGFTPYGNSVLISLETGQAFGGPKFKSVDILTGGNGPTFEFNPYPGEKVQYHLSLGVAAQPIFTELVPPLPPPPPGAVWFKHLYTEEVLPAE